MKRFTLIWLAILGLCLPVLAEPQSATPLISETTFTLSPLVTKTESGEMYQLQAEFYAQTLKDGVIRIESSAWDQAHELRLGDLEAGKHKLEFAIPPVEGPVEITFLSSLGQQKLPTQTLPSPKKWTIYLVQHVHTDIGYTRPQTEILPEHLRYIDYALDYCDLTDAYPDHAKFRWTCEVAWAVDEYLKRRPAAQIQRLKQRVAEGRIELAGMYLNMAETATESSLAASLQPLRTFKEQFNLPVRTALQNDVNGAAWCLVDYFHNLGIEYLSMGINKTRSLLPFDYPTTFWWESPSGKRILAYRADHYHFGNFWGIHDGQVAPFRDGLLGYLASLDERGYPFDRVSVQFSGYHTDNSPPAMISSDMVKEWNKTYAWPQLRIATAQEFLDYVAQNHADDLPTYRQAWPDWWTDGFGSAARETAAARDTHVNLESSQILLAMAATLGATLPDDAMKRVDAVQEQLLFYDEHTYGAAESISDPMAENSMVQWGEKSSYAWEAVKKAGMLREEAMGILQEYLPRAEKPTISVVNTLNWERSGLIELFIDHEMLPLRKRFQIIDTATGQAVPTQLIRSRSEGSYWALWVSDVPALGYKTLRIEASDLEETKAFPEIQDTAGLENPFYTLRMDPLTGSISSLVDKETGKELVDTASGWNLAQVVYESHPNDRVLNQNAFQRTSLTNVSIKPGTDGPLWQSLVIAGDAEGGINPNALHCEIRLFNHSKRIDFLFSLRKKPITQPEGVYIAFPFHQPEAKIVYEAQGGYVTPGVDQIERSSSDWQTIQNFAAVRGQDSQTIFVSGQVPLVQFGDFNLGKWQEIARPEKPYLFSWVMNNYWFTNFRAMQEGEFHWRYTLTTTTDTSNTAAVRLGWGARIPMVTRVFPPSHGQETHVPLTLSALGYDCGSITLVQAYPARYGKGLIVHLREVAGKTTTLPASEWIGNRRIQRADEVTVVEDVLIPDLSTITLKPYESKFFKLTLAD